MSIHYPTYRKAKKGDGRCVDCGSYSQGQWGQRGRCGRMILRDGMRNGVSVGSGHTCDAFHPTPNETTTPTKATP